jgi:hypothetical protein
MGFEMAKSRHDQEYSEKEARAHFEAALRLHFNTTIANVGNFHFPLPVAQKCGHKSSASASI